VDEKAILEKNAIRIIRTGDNSEISGRWKVSHGGTKFSFTPAQPLSANQQYKIQVTTKVRDKRGTRLAEQRESVFTVSNQ
jgi:hypothetical protein